MAKREEIYIEVRVSEVRELERLITKIEIPDVTYSEDVLVMAQQALRLSKLHATTISGILHGWMGDND